MPNDPAATTEDVVIRQMRDQIVENDLKIVQALNQRIALVSRLREYKEGRGMEFVDHSREEWMVRYLQGANRGALSDDGLAEIYSHILELTKRETVD